MTVKINAAFRLRATASVVSKLEIDTNHPMGAAYAYYNISLGELKKLKTQNLNNDSKTFKKEDRVVIINSEYPFKDLIKRAAIYLGPVGTNRCKVALGMEDPSQHLHYDLRDNQTLLFTDIAKV